jgi:hypothetical protein
MPFHLLSIRDSTQHQPQTLTSCLPKSPRATARVSFSMSVYGTSASADSSYIYAVVTFVSIALYNVMELTVIIFVALKKRAGLYFWSFCVATWGIVPYSIGFLLKGLNVNPAAIYAYVTLIIVGWYCTVTGQSVVLYSRLHLVDRNARHLHFVRAMIITNGVILHSVTTVLVYGANSSSDPSRFFRPYSIVEKIQVTIFFVQELTISGSIFLPQSSSSMTRPYIPSPPAPACSGAL